MSENKPVDLSTKRGMLQSVYSLAQAIESGTHDVVKVFLLMQTRDGKMITTANVEDGQVFQTLDLVGLLNYTTHLLMTEVSKAGQGAADIKADPQS